MIKSTISIDVFAKLEMRVGMYRIVYQKIRESIFIVLIGHRRDIYRLTKELLG